MTPKLGLFTATMIVVGSIIGSGIFKKTAPMVSKLQSESLVVWCWVIAGFITLLGALTYAEIAGRLAQTGGLYAYLRSMYGDSVGFLFGWSCFSVIQTASIASIAYVFAEALFQIFPFSFYHLEIKIIAVCTVLLLSSANYVGLVFGAWIENILTVLKVAGIFLVAALAFVFARAPGLEISSLRASVNLPPVGMALVPAMFGAMLGAFWAFEGINNLGFIGGEIRNAKRNVPKALIFGTLLVFAIYLVVNFSYFCALPLDEILSIANLPGKIFAVEMISRLLGLHWSLLVSVLILVSTFGATNGSILVSARIYYAMAKDGLFFKSWAKVHPRFKTPSLALVGQGIWACVLIFFGNFDQLTDLLVFVSFVFYGIGAWGLFGLRKRNIGRPAFVIPAILPVLYISFCVLFAVVTIYQNPLQAAVGLALTLSGWIFFQFNGLAKTIRSLLPCRHRPR